MITEEDITEDRDDFRDLYNQYRPGNVASFSQVKRSSFSQPRTSSSCESGTITSEYSSGNTTRKRFSALPRSKSFGRDPRMTDLMNAYQARADQPGYLPDDTISRDSGHSSAGTPELGWRSRDISRVNSFPQSSYQVGYDTNYNPYSTSDTQSLYSGQSEHSRPRTSDTLALYSGQSEHSRPGTVNLDTRSVHSLNSHQLNWSPMAGDVRHTLPVKRKYSTFDEAISDDDHEVVAKRPRTPENYDEVETSRESSNIMNFLKKFLRICLKLFLLCILVVICLLCFATYKNWQCSLNQSQSIDTDQISGELSSNLFGQQLAASEIVSSLHTFTQSPDSPLLVLILFGWLGSGKTHTANLLSSLLPVQSNTHFITCSLPHSVNSIPSKIAHSCGHSFLVLDDLDSADKDAMDMLEKLIISIYNEPNSKSNGTIIVATTSAGGHSVNKLLLEMSKNSLVSRDSLTSDDILSVLAADQVTIPLHMMLTDYNIPVKLVPFLPLTREHLRMCATRLAMKQGITISDMQVNLILDQVQYFSKELPIFAKTGCKQISAKLDLTMGANMEL